MFRRMKILENNNQILGISWPEVLIFLYFILKPFYISTSPIQFADFLLLILFAYCVLHQREYMFSIHPHTKRAFLMWCCLTAYVCVINFVWFLHLNCNIEEYGTSRLLMSSLYFIYNGIAIYTVLLTYLILGKRLYRVFMYSACFSVALQILMSVVLYDSSVSRQVIAFSNPNQLGYYAIIMLTIGVLWGDYLRTWQLLLFIIGTLYLNFISLSKASIIAGVVLIAFCIIYRYNNKGFFHWKNKVFLIGSGIVCILALLLAGSFGEEASLLQRVFDRITNMGREADSALGNGRGYNRIFEMGVNIFWGMGEGAYERFSVMTGNEVHSTYISLLTSYGIIGLILWLLSMAEFLIRRNKVWFVLVSLSGVALYWITHNGIRNTMVWMVIALLSVSLQSNLEKKCKKDGKEIKNEIFDAGNQTVIKC